MRQRFMQQDKNAGRINTTIILWLLTTSLDAWHSALQLGEKLKRYFECSGEMMEAPAFHATRFVWPVLLPIAFYFSIIVLASLAMVTLAQATDPPTAPPVSGQLTYYGTISGYLCYYPGAPIGPDEAAVALATAQSAGYPTNGFSKQGSGFYDGKHFSWYRENPQTIFPSGLALAVEQYVCPDGSRNASPPAYNCGGMPNARNNPNECCPCGYNYDTAQGMCVLSNTAACPAACPANMSGSPCACNVGFVPDSTATSCVPVPAVACTVTALTAPPFNDACAEVLENINSTQAQKDAACGALTPALQTGMACFRDKLSRTNDLVTGNPIPLKVTSDIRDIAYQAHLRDIWDKMEDLVDRMNKDPSMRTACAARRAEIAAEKGCDKAGPCKNKKDEVCYPESATQRSHCIAGKPALPNPNDAQHTHGNAFDVSRTYTINPLQDVLDGRNPPQDIQQFLDAPTDCKLNWGGTFTDNYDPIHFYAR